MGAKGEQLQAERNSTLIKQHQEETAHRESLDFWCGPLNAQVCVFCRLLLGEARMRAGRLDPHRVFD